MNNSKFFTLLMTVLTIVVLISACEKNGENERKISHYNNTESHETGMNCMNCHRSGGEGEGWFNVGGTVYNEQMNAVFPNATIRLYTGENGTGQLKGTIEVDGKGNFYTTESIDFSGGLFPSVEGQNSTKYMTTAIGAGACNSCHGVSTDKLWTN